MYCNVNAMLILIFGFIRGLMLLKYIVKYIFWIYILKYITRDIEVLELIRDMTTKVGKKYSHLQNQYTFNY